jgi:hypothetical protein
MQATGRPFFEAGLGENCLADRINANFSSDNQSRFLEGLLEVAAWSAILPALSSPLPTSGDRQ